MAENNRVLQLYGDFCRFLRDAESNEFYSFFQNVVQTSPATISVYEKFVERHVDEKWVEALEAAIIPLDTIIRNPRSYIKREEDIIPIAQAREIGPESIRHLAQHTGMIASVEDDRVMPNKILNITKDDSLDTYENRFIYTLLKLAAYFLDKRMAILMKDSRVADLFDYQLDGNCNVGADRISYHVNMHMESPHEEVEDEQLINADVSTMTPLQRVERLRKILYTFQGSAFCKALAGTASVRPPLVMTNVLRKNPDFIKAVNLWNFINSYREDGYTTENIERYRNPSTADRNEMFAIVMLEYVMMKNQCHRTEDMTGAVAEDTGAELTAPKIISRMIDELSDNFGLTVDEIRKVYEKELKKKEKKQEAEFAKARGVFERAIAFEKENDRLSEIRRRERLLEEIRRRLELAEADAKRAEEEERRRAIEEKLAMAGNEEEEISIDENGFAYRYRYSFLARLIQAQDPMQSYYTEVKNHLLSYERVRSVMAWSHESFRCGRNSIVKLTARGKAICMAIALDPTQFEGTKYHVEDLREEGKEVPFPTRFRIKSERGVKYAKYMIDLLMEQLGIAQGDVPDEDYHMPYQTTEELVVSDPQLVKKIGAPSQKTEPAVKTIEELLAEKQREALAAAGQIEEPTEEPAPEPAEEPAEEPVEEPAGEESEDEDGDGAEGSGGREGQILYRYSFLARLIQGQEPIQSYYTAVKNHLLSYEKVKCGMAWSHESFRYGRNTVAKLSCRGKTLCLSLAMDPAQFEGSKYHVEDLSADWKVVPFPTRFRIRSDRGVKYAKEIIDTLMWDLGAVQGEIPAEIYRMPYRTTEELLLEDPPLVKAPGAASSGKRISAALAQKQPDEPEMIAPTEELPDTAEDIPASVAAEDNLPAIPLDAPIPELPEDTVQVEEEAQIPEDTTAGVAEEEPIPEQNEEIPDAEETAESCTEPAPSDGVEKLAEESDGNDAEVEEEPTENDETEPKTEEIQPETVEIDDAVENEADEPVFRSMEPETGDEFVEVPVEEFTEESMEEVAEVSAEDLAELAGAWESAEPDEESDNEPDEAFAGEADEEDLSATDGEAESIGRKPRNYRKMGRKKKKKAQKQDGVFEQYRKKNH